jgi:penicillin-binding protein-related factor A (putative recombinase)
VRRGQYLESQLNGIIKILRDYGIFGQKSHSKRMANGTYLQGEPFDYLILARGKMICFDAKECHGDRWNLKTNAKLSQVENLLLCKANGADSFFLVLFVPQYKLVKFDVEMVRDAVIRGQKSFTSREGELWQWEYLLKPERGAA